MLCLLFDVNILVGHRFLYLLMQSEKKNFSFLTLTGEFCIHFVNIFGEFVHDCNPEKEKSL